MMCRLVITIGLLLVGLVAVSSWHWKELNVEVPPFSDLRIAQANRFRSDMGYGLGKSSIEFFDNQGNRFQAPGIASDERKIIRDALDRNDPVHLYFGPWRSPFSSRKIFTVYQLEIGDTLVIPYSRLAAASENKKNNRFMIMTVSLMIMMVTVAFGITMGLRARRHTTNHIPA